MKRHLEAWDYFPRTYAEVYKAVQKEWDKLKFPNWNLLINSMVECVKECREQKGMQTQW